MPLFAYFSCIGGVLMAFLFLSKAYIALPQDIFRQRESAFSIRIKSSAPKPELVVFDTSIPTIVPQQQAQPELTPVAAVVESAFDSLGEPVLAPKKMSRKRIAKTTIVNVAHLSSHDVSGFSYPPSW